jgi:5-dehydro-2-deoxygluconokinase
MNKREIDIICMGRAAVDLYSEQIGASLEEGSTFAKYVGGCPANISIGTSRLGLKSAILSRVGDEAMGRFVRNSLQREGVDVSHLVTDQERLTGLVLLGISPPDHFPLIFYRENCADMAIEKEDVTDEFLSRSQALLVTGTHCSKDPIFDVTKDTIKRALAVGTKIVLDIDYRPVLWGKTGHGGGEERYRQDSLFASRMAEILPHCDLVVGTEEEILAATDCQDIDEAISVLSQIVPGVIVRKCGEQGCVAYDRHSSEPIVGTPFSVKVLNVLGAGDAFMSGFLRGYLKGHSLRECCTFANANGALVVTRHGCSPAMPYWEELAKFMHSQTDLQVIERMHRRLGNRFRGESLFLLAFDHRGHFERLSNESECGEQQITNFKNLIFEGLQRAMDDQPDITVGLIVDGQYGESVLKEAHRQKIITFRCIESPNSFPIKFIDGKEASYLLRDWPRDQTVKVLCYVSDEQQNVEQIARLRDLYHAVEQSGHQLLIELIDRENDNLDRVTKIIESCYQEGIFPQWWKLQPMDDDSSWQKIEAVIEQHDPYIHGILLLGENRPFEELSETLNTIIDRYEKVKGFAIGRSIWGNAAEEWFKKSITDQDAVQEISGRFKQLIHNKVML